MADLMELDSAMREDLAIFTDIKVSGISDLADDRMTLPWNCTITSNKSPISR